MLKQIAWTLLRASRNAFAESVPSFRVRYTTLSRCKQCGNSRRWYEHLLRNARHFSRRGDSDGSDVEARGPHPKDVSDDSDSEEISSDDNSDGLNSDSEIFDAFQSELAADDDDEDDEEKEAGSSECTGQQSEQTLKDVNLKDDYDYRPWNTKERTKACLDKLKKGPDGRYINVLEVATELDMLIASYLKLRKAEDPDQADNSEDDEKYLEGIDIRKFRRLQKRVREGTYEFQPVVLVPLPKRKIVKLKRKKVKKRHAF